ncbi:hypothetical protein ABW20_dc0109698 [Dactylellina cionopaga]|nr:hypothetical protein ABW20_dc0109698 [Dactylellina cionopaga]
MKEPSDGELSPLDSKGKGKALQNPTTTPGTDSSVQPEQNLEQRKAAVPNSRLTGAALANEASVSAVPQPSSGGSRSFPGESSRISTGSAGGSLANAESSVAGSSLSNTSSFLSGLLDQIESGTFNSGVNVSRPAFGSSTGHQGKTPDAGSANGGYGSVRYTPSTSTILPDYSKIMAKHPTSLTSAAPTRASASAGPSSQLLPTAPTNSHGPVMPHSTASRSLVNGGSAGSRVPVVPTPAASVAATTATVPVLPGSSKQAVVKSVDAAKVEASAAQGTSAASNSVATNAGRPAVTLASSPSNQAVPQAAGTTGVSAPDAALSVPVVSTSAPVTTAASQTVPSLVLGSSQQAAASTATGLNVMTPAGSVGASTDAITVSAEVVSDSTVSADTNAGSHGPTVTATAAPTGMVGTADAGTVTAVNANLESANALVGPSTTNLSVSSSFLAAVALVTAGLPAQPVQQQQTVIIPAQLATVLPQFHHVVQPAFVPQVFPPIPQQQLAPAVVNGPADDEDEVMSEAGPLPEVAADVEHEMPDAPWDHEEEMLDAPPLPRRGWGGRHIPLTQKHKMFLRKHFESRKKGKGQRRKRMTINLDYVRGNLNRFSHKVIKIDERGGCILVGRFS